MRKQQMREVEGIARMITTTTAATTNNTGSLMPINNKKNKQSKQEKCSNFSSSAFASIPIPESVRDAVKSTVLDEATRNDSKFWGVKKVNGSSNNTRKQQQQHSHPSVNDPISPLRLQLLHDPLDEWYLDETPTSVSSSSSFSSFIIPEGVQPLSDAVDPFLLSKKDMETLSEGIRTDLIGTDHPVLTRAAAYFFDSNREGGKKIRPMMVLLLSRAMAISASASSSSSLQQEQQHDEEEGLFTPPMPWQRPDLPAAQRRLAEISEMLHTASLFHDDVIDGSDTRRGEPSANAQFGNKTAILAGDYILARACIYLARLRNVETVETISTVIEHLVRGEVMQMRGSAAGDLNNTDDGVTPKNPLSYDHMIYYLRKNFYKTGSLMANSCKSAAVLGDYDDEIVHAAYRYGKHLGVAFQLIDDALDYEGSAMSLGKPGLADLNAGLSTAPILFALQEKEELSSSGAQGKREMEEIISMMKRKYRNNGDIERAVEFVNASDGIRKTKDLALVHVEVAVEAIMEHLEPSVYRDALVHLAYKVVDRSR